MRAVVVGASSGLGRCIGIGLVKRGAEVALLARRREKLDTAVDEAGAGAFAVDCDVTDPASTADAIAATAMDFLPLSGATILLDAGTTTARIAAQLPTDREFTVVTNSVPIAARLAGSPTITLQLLGGRVRGLTQAAVGEHTLSVREDEGLAMEKAPLVAAHLDAPLLEEFEQVPNRR